MTTRERIERIRSVMQEAYELLGFKDVSDREYGVVCALAQAIEDLTEFAEEERRERENVIWRIAFRMSDDGPLKEAYVLKPTESEAHNYFTQGIPGASIKSIKPMTEWLESLQSPPPS